MFISFIRRIKKIKIENQLSKGIQLQRNQKHKDDILLKYYDEHKDEIEKLTNNQQIIKKCNNSINSLQESPFINIYKEILKCSIEIIMEFQEFKKIKDFDKKDKFCDIIEKFLITVSQEKNGSNQLIELLDYFSKIESLNHTADLCELLIFLLHKKISIRYYIFKNKYDKNLDKELKYLIYNIKLDENFICLIFENNCNNINSNDKYKYKFSILHGKKYENSKNSINMFEILYKTKNNNLINGYICKSIFMNNENIIIIKINIDIYKETKFTFEEIKNKINKEINQINENFPFLKITNSYIQLNNKIILYDQSYETYLKEMIEPFLIKEDIKKEIKNENNSLKKIKIKK